MTLHQPIINELQHIPQDKLAEIYDAIHYFRLGLARENPAERQPGILKTIEREEARQSSPDEAFGLWQRHAPAVDGLEYQQNLRADQAPTESDAKSRFLALASRGNPSRGLALLDKLDRLEAEEQAASDPDHNR